MILEVDGHGVVVALQQMCPQPHQAKCTLEPHSKYKAKGEAVL